MLITHNYLSNNKNSYTQMTLDENLFSSKINNIPGSYFFVCRMNPESTDLHWHLLNTDSNIPNIDLNQYGILIDGEVVDQDIIFIGASQNSGSWMLQQKRRNLLLMLNTRPIYMRSVGALTLHSLRSSYMDNLLRPKIIQ